MDSQQHGCGTAASAGRTGRCLTRAYDRRLDELERSLERVYRNGPF